MARTIFVAGAVKYLLLVAVIVAGLFWTVLLIRDGQVGNALLLLLLGIPIALWVANFVLSIAWLLLLYPIALVTGSRRELAEFTNFQVAVVEGAGVDRLRLRDQKALLRMFEELPPPVPGQPPRSGDELIALYNELHPEREEEEEEEEAVEPPRSEEPAPARAVTKAAPQRTRRPSRRTAIPGKVLVIDDEAPIRILCRVNLEEEGMDVIEAEDGPTGLQKAREHRPDVVLLNVMMPGPLGWRVAKELLAGEQTREIPIMFLTARSKLRDRLRGLELGAVDYVTKPFNPLELAPRIREILDRVARGEREELRRERIEEVRALMEQDPNGRPTEKGDSQ